MSIKQKELKFWAKVAGVKYASRAWAYKRKTKGKGLYCGRNRMYVGGAPKHKILNLFYTMGIFAFGSHLRIYLIFEQFYLFTF